jgi:hypothetical protein
MIRVFFGGLQHCLAEIQGLGVGSSGSTLPRGPEVNLQYLKKKEEIYFSDKKCSTFC